MSRIRDIRSKTRRALHNRMAQPAALYVGGFPDAILCTIRSHDKHRLIGDVKGTSFDFGERHEDTPEVVFLLEEFLDDNNTTFADSPFSSWDEIIERDTVIRLVDDDTTGEAIALKIDSVDAVHGITVNAYVTRLSTEKACIYTAPPEDMVCPPMS